MHCIWPMGVFRDGDKIFTRGVGEPNRLLKNAHLLRFPHPSSLRRTFKYASFLRISGVLHLGFFEQPAENDFFCNLLDKPPGNVLRSSCEVSCILFSCLDLEKWGTNQAWNVSELGKISAQIFCGRRSKRKQP